MQRTGRQTAHRLPSHAPEPTSGAARIRGRGDSAPGPRLPGDAAAGSEQGRGASPGPQASEDTGVNALPRSHLCTTTDKNRSQGLTVLANELTCPVSDKVQSGTETRCGHEGRRCPGRTGRGAGRKPRAPRTLGPPKASIGVTGRGVKMCPKQVRRTDISRNLRKKL